MSYQRCKIVRLGSAERIMSTYMHRQLDGSHFIYRISLLVKAAKVDFKFSSICSHSSIGRISYSMVRIQVFRLLRLSKLLLNYTTLLQMHYHNSHIVSKQCELIFC